MFSQNSRNKQEAGRVCLLTQNAPAHTPTTKPSENGLPEKGMTLWVEN